MPGQAEVVAQPPHRPGDDAEVLGDERQLAERVARRVEHRAARAAAPAAAERVARALRHRPVGDEAAEVVDPREVEERERAREPRDPPRVALAPQRRPVVQRVAPQLALVGVRVGRRAGDGVVDEQLAVRAVVGGAGRDVDRDVADQPHAARRSRTRAARSTRARSAPGRRPRRGRRSAPSPRSSSASRSRKSSSSALRDRARAARRAAPATRRTPTSPCTATRSGRAGRAAASATTSGRRRRASRPTRTRRGPSRPAGKRGRMQLHARGCGKLHAPQGYVATFAHAATRIRWPPRCRSRRRPASTSSTRQPAVDAGRYPAKRTVGDLVEVRADVFRDGHEKLRAVAVLPRATAAASGARPSCTRSTRTINGVRWGGAFVVDEPGRWEFAIEAWTDVFATWRDELQRKLEAGQHDLSGELSEGVLLLRGRRRAREGRRPQADRARAARARRRGDPRGREARRRARASSCSPPSSATPSATASRGSTRRSRWRSTACAPASAPGTRSSRARGAGSKGVEAQVPALAELGFDVVYLTPIHPIGRTNRKGRNNALVAGPDDPGSPVRGRRRRGRPRRRAPGHRHRRRRARAVRDRRRARHGRLPATSPSTRRPTTPG